MYGINHIKSKISIIVVIIGIALSVSLMSAWAEREDDEWERGEIEHGAAYESEDGSGDIPAPAAAQPAEDVTTSAPVSAPTSSGTVTAADNTAASAAEIARLKANINVLIDSDLDGIPDTLDRHPGEDDFAYIITDRNGNGLADDLEALIR